jgi:hypothetical protein
VLRVAGSGPHERGAAPIAANLGVLDLTGPAAVHARSAMLLVARSAVLTLRNGRRQDLGRSLVPESVPAPVG